MNLKFRYAAFLLLTFLMLVITSMLTVHLLWQKWYLALVILFILLYFTTYQLGRKFSIIFFVLSTLRLLRKNHGTLHVYEYEAYIDKLCGNRRNTTSKDKLKRKILEILQQENEITIADNTIILLNLA